MSLSALSIDDHFSWMLCHVEILRRIAALVALSRDVPQFASATEFCSFTISIGAKVSSHALAVRAALPSHVLRQEAPWVADGIDAPKGGAR
jgi:hypothetical protein